MNIILKRFFYFFIFLAIFTNLSCAVNPVTHKKELMLLSQSDELALGKQTDRQISQTYGIYEDQNLKDYLSSLGNKLAKVSHLPDLPFNFQVLDSSVVNAFAVPGGYVYLTREILAYINDEAELAGVMGHEIGHITARHSAQMYSRAQLAQMGLVLGAALSKSFRKYAGMLEAGLSVLFLSFSRENERQADDLGVLYSSKAGYDAEHMANLFITLERLNPSSGSDGLPSWLSTHPNPPDRISAIKKAASKFKTQNPDLKFSVGREEYLKKIDGIVFGDDPRQGYLEGQIFYHPRLKVQFPFPQNWKYNKSNNYIQMVSPNQDAVMALSVSDEKTPDEAARNFVRENNLNILNSDVKTINGLYVRRLEFSVQTERENIKGLANFIKYEEKVLAFLGYTVFEKYNSYAPAILKSLNQLKPLTDSAHLNVIPEKIKIVRVEKEDIFENILKKHNFPQEKFKKLAILNGVELTSKVPSGSLIKLVSK
ncbi:MAG: M48 family metalloprotease [Thermoanaerobaculia bacterium]